jgi:N-dimethylarginine dimethylaminohydrolase
VTTSKPFKPPYVRDDAGTLRGVIVAPPSDAIERERPLLGESSAIAERARAQHEVFVGRLAAHGVKVVTLDADPVAPFGSLCADAAIVFPNGAFIMRPSDVARRREVVAVEAALELAGIPVAGRIEAPGLLEGATFCSPATRLTSASRHRAVRRSASRAVCTETSTAASNSPNSCAGSV